MVALAANPVRKRRFTGDASGNLVPDNAPNAASVHYGDHRIRDVMPAGSGNFADSDLRDGECKGDIT